MHDFHERHDNALRISGRVDVGNHIFDHRARHALFRRLKRSQCSICMVFGTIQTRHINAMQTRQPAQAFFARNAFLLALFHHVDGFQCADFTIADGKRVDKRIQRFRIKRTRAARNHNRMLPRAILAAKRNTGKIKHFQNIGITHLILKRKAPHVKSADGRTRFQRKKRHALLTHQIGHIDPRHKDALTKRILPFIDDIIQNA